MTDAELINEENRALRQMLERKDAQIKELLHLLDRTTADQSRALDRMREAVLLTYRRNLELEREIYTKPLKAACPECRTRNIE